MKTREELIADLEKDYGNVENAEVGKGKRYFATSNSARDTWYCVELLSIEDIEEGLSDTIRWASTDEAWGYSTIIDLDTGKEVRINIKSGISLDDL